MGVFSLPVTEAEGRFLRFLPGDEALLLQHFLPTASPVPQAQGDLNAAVRQHRPQRGAEGTAPATHPRPAEQPLSQVRPQVKAKKKKPFQFPLMGKKGWEAKLHTSSSDLRRGQANSRLINEELQRSKALAPSSVAAVQVH